jgi:hypothetical protein
MNIDKIPRFHASVDGGNVFLTDSPKGGLINTTLLHSALQRRRVELREEYRRVRDSEASDEIYGRIMEIEDIIRALGEEPR